jgi:hypothetical protein
MVYDFNKTAKSNSIDTTIGIKILNLNSIEIIYIFKIKF